MRLLLLAVLVLSTGCGVIESMNDKCGGEHEDLCLAILGGAEDAKNRAGDAEQQTQIDLLLQMIETNNLNLSNQILALEALGQSNTNLINGLQTQIDNLQLQINNNISQIAILHGYNNIVDTIDICGDGPGVDEVLLRLSNGKILASFSQNASGLNTRFAILTPGNYVSTDSQNCFFTVQANGNVVW
jgi:hypothetical protein